ncbi:serine/threonine protein kinase [Mycoplasmopsis californica]|uniref:Serine/threonine protein kinase n=2 Tax=Mycoplasmopsis californica TaxID=2113 RepID=A0A059XVK0_9BACT|nr:serine/threonine-protein kinase [Mycoplasmopsis californica]AIA29346.1 serine/threonine protein kinase [Mycoplasmopsis californica]
MLPKNDSKVYKKYKIISQIGKGGFSYVYKVELLSDPSKVYALKYFFVAGESEKENTLKRFEQEIKLYKSIHSNRIAEFVEASFDAQEQYLVMELVNGETLKNEINKGGKLIARTAVNYAMQIAEGLGELHSNKIIHRDIKSTNIMITSDRNVKIIDFGLALREDSQRFTQAQKVIGTVYYMAPELCYSDNKPSVRSDIYALGILIYEMLTGDYPFKGQSAVQTMNKQKNSPLPDITKIVTVPQGLANVIMKATNKDPQKRYASMWELRSDLSTCLDSSRFYEKVYDPNKDDVKKTFQDFINSKAFLYTAIAVTSTLLLVGLILICVFIR